MTPEEGNNLIRLFIGDEFVMEKLNSSGQWNENRDLLYNEDLRFNSSWDWLMPVVGKIESIKTDTYYGFRVEIKGEHCCIVCYEKNCQLGVIYQTPYEFKVETKIEVVWLAVIEFIKWYNKQ